MRHFFQLWVCHIQEILRNGPVQCIATTLPVPYMENHMVLRKYTKQIKLSGVTEHFIIENTQINNMASLWESAPHNYKSCHVLTRTRSVLN